MRVKRLVAHSIALLLTAAFSLCWLSSKAQAVEIFGWDNGNAGDTIAAEFRLTGRDLVQRLELLVQASGPVYDTTALKIAVETTKVTSQEKVFLNGDEVDAKNYFPTAKHVEVNRSRWREYRKATETKGRFRVTLHEYLWVSGVDDTGFKESDRLIELLSIKNYSPNIWWNPVNPVNYFEATLVAAPKGCEFVPTRLSVRSADEVINLEPRGECGDAYRRIRVAKSTGITPAASNVRGLFHTFDVSIFDRAGTTLGQMNFEPEWGACLLPEQGACRGSGRMKINGVAFTFWFLRE